MKNNTPLTPAGAKAIADAFKTWAEISDKRVRTANDDAEQRGLLQFLNTELLAHAPEFLGCWIAVHTEYQPLIQGVTGLLRRAQAQSTADAPEVKEAKTNA